MSEKEIILSWRNKNGHKGDYVGEGKCSREGSINEKGWVYAMGSLVIGLST